LRNANPGLDSRVPNRIRFFRYSNEDLIRIFKKLAADSEYVVADDCDERLTQLIDAAIGRDGRKFGNGRFIRTMFEKAILRQGNRLVPKSQFTADALKQILPQDLPDSIEEETPK
ncbi:hypothetical protein, partial [Nitrospira sp. BLG_2]|uniref:hypothetical protein n=1 Tax=Nitrospira sp. BLG_2 TaxID=3397507 RepID=UPI003B9A47DC